MENKIYSVKRNIKGFNEGDIVLAYVRQKFKTKTMVTNWEIVGKWSCCGCNKYKQELIDNKHLEYIGTL